MAKGLEETAIPEIDPRLEQALSSFPGQTLTLPMGSYVLASRPNLYGTLSRERVLAECMTYLRQALDHLGLSSPPRLLLVLPDKTRTNIAAHLLLDVVLSLQTECPGLQFTVLFGLGTHPPMTEQDLEQWLEPQRYHQLKIRGISLRQQTTLAPLQPQATVEVREFPEMSASSFSALHQAITQLQGHLTAMTSPGEPLTLERYLEREQALKETTPFQTASTGPENPPASTVPLATAAQQGFSLSLPLELWQHHLTLVAGDTELHPYEVRGGSGGIHKMLAVGLADLQTIRRTHSTRILLDATSPTAEANNAFVRSLDHIIADLYQDLLHRPDSLACTIPLGLSIASLQPGCINGLWLGQAEPARQQLTRIVRHSNTVRLSQATHLVIGDADRKKGTDILAGARALQTLCEEDRGDNVLLADSPRQRVALLFNPCLETRNHGGIGNLGTKKQLDVLGQLVHECQGILQAQLSAVETFDQALTLVQARRRQILTAWTHHLLLVSDFPDFLDLLKTLIRMLRQLASINFDPQKIGEYLQSSLSNYANHYSDEGRMIHQLQAAYLSQPDLEALFYQVSNLQQAYTKMEGLGEGGQRALRLLKILQNFETFLLATDNVMVLNYLEALDPDLAPCLPAPLGSGLINQGLRFGLLGITGIDLTRHACQQALDKAIDYIEFYNSQSKNYQITFLPKPLIIKNPQTESSDLRK
ncbi:hypothetical protein OLK001_21190 [Synechocystis sp. LKSZ1]